MLKSLRHFFARLRPPSDEDRERAYLAAATDRCDLEYRQRQIERGRFERRPAIYSGMPPR